MGKSSSIVTGYHYRPAFHHALGRGPIDAYLEWRIADKPGWQGELTASGTITVSKPHLFGGTKDQGGVEGDVDIMFGEADQLPNPYLVSTFGPQTVAWRGFTTMAFKGGRYGANNPYAHPNASKIRKILKGWDNDDPWYPEKAVIFVESSVTPTVQGYWRVEAGARYTLEDDTTNYGIVPAAYVADANTIGQNAIAARNSSTGSSFVWAGSQYTVLGVADDPAIVAWAPSHGPSIGISAIRATPVCPVGYSFYPEEGPSPPTSTGSIDSPIVMCVGPTLQAMNPAHILVYSRTDSERGREPLVNINAASLTAAADKLYAEGFGLCTEYDPANESPVEFEQRISRVIAGSFERSLTDGQWYLDLARGDYDIETLPILTDDDILEFKEQPTTLDRAVNSLSVRYFDPEKKELIVTPAVRALGLIRKFGEIHETLDFPEIPTGALALRVAERELRARCTPTHGFKLVTTPRTYAWRRNQYFRLQSVKRGIADMVCIVGQKSRGTLKSGAIDLVATQDIYSLPDSSYVEVEPGVDPSPPQVPGGIEIQRADEAPYFELASRLPRAELAALPSDAGYVMAIASDPDEGRDFTMMVAPDGGDFDEASTGYWCPTASTLAAAGMSTTVVELDLGYLLDQVEIGAPALWDDEIVRVDAKDLLTGTVTLGRGCADTVPVTHAAGSRIWFYDLHAASDTTEYTDGETVEVRLLTNTGSDQLDIGLATPMDVTLDQRAYRPYPPARLRVNGDANPASAFGSLEVTWAHRDRVLQADQLVDTEAAAIGPEVGTTYTLRWYLDDVLEHTHSGVTGATQVYSPAGEGFMRLEVESVRDGVVSWQMQVREFFYIAGEVELLTTESGDLITTEDGDPIALE